jgi:hypothetical protein
MGGKRNFSVCDIWLGYLGFVLFTRLAHYFLGLLFLNENENVFCQKIRLKCVVENFLFSFRKSAQK